MANSVNYQHFKTLLNAYEKAYPEKNKNACQNAVAEIWKHTKKDYPSSDELRNEVDRKSNEWKEFSIPKKSKMTDFWSGVQKKSTNVTIKLPPTASQESTESSLEPTESVTLNDTQSSTETTPSEASIPSEAPTPAQEEVKRKINIENDILVGLYRKRDIGQLSQNDRNEISSREATLKKYKTDLKQKELNRKQQQKFRSNQKRKLIEIEKQTGEKLSKQSRDEEREAHNKELMAAISRIAISGSAAHERRRSEIIRTVKTLDQLTEALNREGYSLKRSSVYLHFLLRNSLTKEGKRHVTTAPVKLISAKNSKHQNHPCTNFAKAAINALEELAGLLGPREVTFYSQDDKAEVLIGITAARKQALLLMQMEYKVILPDYDYVVASQHKLIPSVIGDMQVRENDFSGDAVTYSGPTYCTIRNA